MASVTLAWAANPPTDNVTAYEVWGANGTSTAFGSCSLLATVNALTWTDVGLPNSQARTYYIVAVNAIGPGAPVGPTNITTAALSGAYVTSVGLTMPAGFSIAGSPVTGAGTLAVSLAYTPLHAYTVATLPTPSQPALALVTDATLTAITGLGLPPVGGGTNKVVVYYDGTGWFVL